MLIYLYHPDRWPLGRLADGGTFDALPGRVGWTAKPLRCQATAHKLTDDALLDIF
ncbi:hypothetical protein BC826DRAFT_1036661, partial [Russula brevipes]